MLRHVIIAVIVIAVLALMVAEVAPIVWLRFSSIQEAEDLASIVGQDYVFYHDESKSLELAAQKLQEMGYSDDEIRESVVQFLPAGNPNKETISVTIVKYANTVVTRHVSFLKKYSRIATTREASLTTTGQNK